MSLVLGWPLAVILKAPTRSGPALKDLHFLAFSCSRSRSSAVILSPPRRTQDLIDHDRDVV